MNKANNQNKFTKYLTNKSKKLNIIKEILLMNIINKESSRYSKENLTFIKNIKMKALIV